jgi:gp16 family phage-associated protein
MNNTNRSFMDNLTKEVFMKTQKLLTPQEIRAEWFRKGLGQNDWARKNGFNPVTVSQVLNGINKCSKGEGHKVAVMLGLKDGEIVDAASHE